VAAAEGYAITQRRVYIRQVGTTYASNFKYDIVRLIMNKHLTGQGF
jgi:hypothetical protein